MSKKFFSLLSGNKIHIAPGTKIIPAEEFTKLQSVDEVLDALHKDVEEYKKQVAAECEKHKELGRKEGYEAGFAAWAEKLAELEHEIKHVREEVEKVVTPVALKAAKKIVGKEMELHKDTIADIVANTLKTVASHKKIVIYANKNDISSLEKNKARLKQIFENLESLSIRQRDDVVSGCIIETDRGIINAQLANQWEILEEAFKKFVKIPTRASEEIVKKPREQSEENNSEKNENEEEGLI